MGCPLRRLYGCGFPHYFGYHQFKLLRENELRPDWVNVWRATDYIGGWISSSSHDRPANTTIGTVDVWIADPVSYAPVPGDNSVSIVNLHSDYFPDPLVADEVRRLLATMT